MSTSSQIAELVSARVEFRRQCAHVERGGVSRRLGAAVDDADQVITLLRAESSRPALQAAPVFDLLVGAGFTRQDEQRIADTIVTTWVRQ